MIESWSVPGQEMLVGLQGDFEELLHHLTVEQHGAREDEEGPASGPFPSSRYEQTARPLVKRARPQLRLVSVAKRVLSDTGS